MIIGIFSESYLPVVNGVSVSIATLAGGLRELGHQVYIFAPSVRGHQDEDNTTHRFPSFRTWIEPEYPLAVPYSPAIERSIARLGLDVIHTQTPFMLGWAGLRMARKLGIPLISTNHTQYPEYAHYFPYAPRSLTRSFIVRLLRFYYNRCDAVVVPSRAMEGVLRDYGIRVPLHVVPTGNSLAASASPDARLAIREQHNVPPDARVLLYVGRLAREKNLELLFDSFDTLADEFDDIRLMVVGGGPFEDECRRITAAAKHSGRIVLTGPVQREKVADYYAAGDIFAFPSTTETQGLVVGEALQAGLPCVLVRQGGSPEMVVEGEEGLLSENTVVDFTAKIRILLNDPEMAARMSSKAVMNCSRPTPIVMASSMLKVYESAGARTTEAASAAARP